MSPGTRNEETGSVDLRANLSAFISALSSCDSGSKCRLTLCLTSLDHFYSPSVQS